MCIRDSGLGGPTGYLFLCLASFLAKPDADIGGNNRKGVSSLLKVLEELSSSADVLEYCKSITIRQCFKKEQSKLTLVFKTNETRQVIHASLLQLGLTHKAEQAPPGQQEDQLEKWLQAIQI